MKHLVKALILMIITSWPTPPVCDAGCIAVRKAQAILKELNYFPDAVDGVLGTASTKAIRTFQADYGLDTNGKLDQATCTALMAEEKRMVKKRLREKRERIIRGSQARLNELGYYHGPINGRGDAISNEVIEDFQKEHQLSPTGRLDGATLKTLFSDRAHEKIPEMKPEPRVEPVTEPVAPEPKAVTLSPGRVTASSPRWTWSVGSMQYEPKSLYDATDYDALNNTLNPEQAVTYTSESYLINRLILTLTDYQFYLATSRLGGGDNAADFLGFLWSFELMKKPLLLVLDYSIIESDAAYNLQERTVSTDSFNSELLLRARPGFLWGLNLTYETYPTLVSARAKDGPSRSIRFDEDFSLGTASMVFHYDTVTAGKTGLFRSDRFYPYMTLGVYGGISYGNVSGSVLDALSADLSHAFDAAIYNLNLRLAPEIGITYIFNRSRYNLELTLGYGADVRWPAWKLPQHSDDDVEFYRRDLSHGLIFGLNMTF